MLRASGRSGLPFFMIETAQQNQGVLAFAELLGRCCLTGKKM
jgi:hypothetical protein